MGPKEVKREQASEDEYTDVETEHEEEPGAEHPTRAERLRTGLVLVGTQVVLQRSHQAGHLRDLTRAKASGAAEGRLSIAPSVGCRWATMCLLCRSISTGTKIVQRTSHLPPGRLHLDVSSPPSAAAEGS